MPTRTFPTIKCKYEVDAELGEIDPDADVAMYALRNQSSPYGDVAAPHADQAEIIMSKRRIGPIGLLEVEENFIVTSDADLVRSFHHAFEKLWKQMT